MSNASSNATEQCYVAMARTDVRNGRTNEEGFSPTADTSSSVTRTRTYGDFPNLSEHQRRRRGECTARTAENVAVIVEMTEDGDSAHTIARRLGISSRVVERARHDLGLTPPPPCVDEVAVERAMSGDRTVNLNTAETSNAVAQLTARGLSARAIAELLGVAERTVTRHRVNRKDHAA